MSKNNFIKYTFFILLSLVPLIILSSTRLAANNSTLYVATNGNDSNPGTSTQPLKTIQRAVDLSAAGDTIYVSSGKYNEAVRIKRSGTEGNPIRLLAAPGEQPIIDGKYSLPSGPVVPWTQGTVDAHGGTKTGLGFVYAGLLQIEGSHWVVDGFVVERSRGRGVNIDTAEDITTSNLVIKNNRASGWLSIDSNNTTLLDSDVWGNANFAPFSRSSAVMNWPVIVAGVNSSDIRIENTDIHRNWGEGLATDRYTENVVFRNNRIWDNYALNLYVHWTRDALIEHNIIWHSQDNTFNRGSDPSQDLVVNLESNFDGPQKNINVIIRNNLIISRRSAISLWNNEGVQNITGPIKIYNNTLLSSGLNLSILNVAGNADVVYKDSEIRNNIFFHSNGGPVYSGPSEIQRRRYRPAH